MLSLWESRTHPGIRNRPWEILQSYLLANHLVETHPLETHPLETHPQGSQRPLNLQLSHLDCEDYRRYRHYQDYPYCPGFLGFQVTYLLVHYPFPKATYSLADCQATYFPWTAFSQADLLLVEPHLPLGADFFLGPSERLSEGPFQLDYSFPGFLAIDFAEEDFFQPD